MRLPNLVLMTMAPWEKKEERRKSKVDSDKPFLTLIMDGIPCWRESKEQSIINFLPVGSVRYIRDYIYNYFC
jgi:hypothetical protein